MIASPTAASAPPACAAVLIASSRRRSRGRCAGRPKRRAGTAPACCGARRTSKPGFAVPFFRAKRQRAARRRARGRRTRAHLRLDHRTRELDVAHVHAQRPRGPDVPGDVLRGDREDVRARRGELAADLPVPADRTGRLLAAGEDEPLAVDEEHCMRPLGQLVGDAYPVGLPVAVRRDRERHLPRPDRVDSTTRGAVVSTCISFGRSIVRCCAERWTRGL